MACTVCAPRVNGKPYALATAGPSGLHECSGRRVTSRVISWHVTYEAAYRARLAYRRKHANARVWITPSKAESERKTWGHV
jgi:hypothetical protein